MSAAAGAAWGHGEGCGGSGGGEGGMGDGSRRLEAHTGRAIRRGAVGVDGHRHVEAQLPHTLYYLHVMGSIT